MKPSSRQRICIAPRVCLAIERSAWIAVSGLPAQICNSRSPPVWAGSRSSLGNDRIPVR